MTSNNNNNDKLASLIKSMSGGDDCDRPACDDTKSALSAALQHVGNKVDGASSSSSSISKKKQTQHIEENEKKNRYTACPPTRDEIGSSTWSLLHSMVCIFFIRALYPSLSHSLRPDLISILELSTHHWFTFNLYILNTGSMVSNQTIKRRQTIHVQLYDIIGKILSMYILCYRFSKEYRNKSTSVSSLYTIVYIAFVCLDSDISYKQKQHMYSDFNHKPIHHNIFKELKLEKIYAFGYANNIIL